MTTTAMRLTPHQSTAPTDDHLATLASLRARWRLTTCQAAALLWMTTDEVRRWEADEAAPVQPETLTRLLLADDVDLTLAAHLGGPSLIPYWLRMRNPALGGTPLEALAGPTAAVRQLRWRLRAELAERGTGGVAR